MSIDGISKFVNPMDPSGIEFVALVLPAVALLLFSFALCKDNRNTVQGRYRHPSEGESPC